MRLIRLTRFIQELTAALDADRTLLDIPAREVYRHVEAGDLISWLRTRTGGRAPSHDLGAAEGEEIVAALRQLANCYSTADWGLDNRGGVPLLICWLAELIQQRDFADESGPRAGGRTAFRPAEGLAGRGDNVAAIDDPLLHDPAGPHPSQASRALTFAEALAAGVAEPTLLATCECSGVGRAVLSAGAMMGRFGPARWWRDGAGECAWVGREDARKLLDAMFAGRGIGAMLTRPPAGELWSVAVLHGVVRVDRIRPLPTGAMQRVAAAAYIDVIDPASA